MKYPLLRVFRMRFHFSDLPEVPEGMSPGGDKQVMNIVSVGRKNVNPEIVFGIGHIINGLIPHL